MFIEYKACLSIPLGIYLIPTQLYAAEILLSKKKVNSLSHVQFFVTPWTVAYQVPMSMGFSMQEY